MWKTPVSSAGGVLKAMANDLFSSGQASHSARAPEASWRNTYAHPEISARGSAEMTVNPAWVVPTASSAFSVE